jgi:hypothetical protein
LSNWRTVLDQGLTKHENWWPAIYEQACRNWNEKPDSKAMAFATTIFLSEVYYGQISDPMRGNWNHDSNVLSDFVFSTSEFDIVG